MCHGDCRRIGPSVPAAEVLDRRGFLTRAGALAVGAVLAACGDGQIGAALVAGPSGPGAELVVDPAAFPALGQVGGIARVDPAGGGTGPVAVVRTGAASWTAFSLACPHQGTTVDISGAGFLCPNHGARFDIAGANIGGQSTGPLHALTIAERADGMLVIAGVGTGGTGDDDDDEEDEDDDDEEGDDGP